MFRKKYEDFQKYYKILDSANDVGNFNNGQPRKCVQLVTNVEYYFKSIGTNANVPLVKELNHLIEIDHPCMMHIYEVYETADYSHFIFQNFDGHKLVDILQLQPEMRFDDKKASFIMNRILSSIKYLRRKRIFYNDFNLENLFVDGDDYDNDIKFSDLGLLYGSDGKQYSQCDSDSIVSLISAGLLAFSLVTGIRPSNIEKGHELTSLQSYQEFHKLSCACRSFISMCLDYVDSSKGNLPDIQSHIWLRPSGRIRQSLSSYTLFRLKAYLGKSHFSRALMLSLSYSLNTEQIQGFRKEFLKFDEQGCGEITFTDFRKTLQFYGIISENEARHIFAAINVTKTDFLNYHEFIAAMISEQEITEQNLQAAFGLLSCHQNLINATVIRRILGNSFTNDDFDRILAEVGLFPYSFISYSEFQRLLGLYKGEARFAYAAPTSSSVINISDNSNAIVAEIEGVLAMAARRQLQCITENMVTEDCTADLELIYSIEKSTILGSGITGVVTLCRHRTSGKEYALKILNKIGLSPKKLDSLRQEIRIMAKLDHPNILRLHECFETTDKFYMILDLCTGGELLDSLNNQPNHLLSETRARKLIHDMLGAVRYCHDHHIVHRDLKLENFLFENRSSTSELKLIDFGLSCYFHPNDSLHDAVGTPYYVAPEVLSKNYNEKCDMWSIGVMAYMLLSGTPPFYGADDNAVLKVVKTGKFVFHPNIFDSISAAGKDFISKCLVKNPECRISAAEAQKHAWFTSGEVNAEPVSPDIVRKLRGFVDRKPLSRLFMEVLSHTMTTGDNLNEIRREFAKIDKDESGEISYEDLRQALLRQGSSISEADMMVLYDTMDVEHMGKIRYHEFIASVIDINVIEEENLRVAFDKLSHHSEFITVADIRDLLGKDATPEEMNRLLDNYMGPSSRLSYTDFKEIVQEGNNNNNLNSRELYKDRIGRSQSDDSGQSKTSHHRLKTHSVDGTRRSSSNSTTGTTTTPPSTTNTNNNIRLPPIIETQNNNTTNNNNSHSHSHNRPPSSSSSGVNRFRPTMSTSYYSRVVPEATTTTGTTTGTKSLSVCTQTTSGGSSTSTAKSTSPKPTTPKTTAPRNLPPSLVKTRSLHAVKSEMVASKPLLTSEIAFLHENLLNVEDDNTSRQTTATTIHQGTITTTTAIEISLMSQRNSNNSSNTGTCTAAPAIMLTKNKFPINTTTIHPTPPTQVSPNSRGGTSGFMNRIAQLGNFSAAIHLTTPNKSNHKFSRTNQY